MLKSSLAAIFVMAVSSSAIAKVEVIDSEPVSSPGAVTVYPGPAPSVTPSVSSRVASGSSDYSQIQAMQEEIQQLRGLVEQQANDIKRLKTQREEDYMDLDRRISALGKGGASTASHPADEAGLSEKKPSLTEKKSPKKDPASSNQSLSSEAPEEALVDAAVATSSVAAVPNKKPRIADDPSENADGSSSADAGADEFTVYSSALNLIVKSKDYDGGIAAMNKYLAQFPKGKYAPNALFWVGSAYQSQNKPDKAIESYERMIKRYPKEVKSDEARLRLARVYFQRGDKEEARVVLDEIVEGGGPQAKAAQDMLSKNF
ncbi:MAG TPA: tetratricopeptide repeat protein [Cellvibrionaceae bacterium]|nr:tetratricopeptide repeat protein [Cellvibrionaceae bacterium]HMW71441.1 tetratricopeptide repeat protein [Cellvibrionaceae bacterium]HMY38465.1 tetratricopeptide repeat protein [Marinagarivorans sp.]HNG59491.1 tetratricopeptide repeat protein [Cellvibrionaceae bacterium]